MCMHMYVCLCVWMCVCGFCSCIYFPVILRLYEPPGFGYAKEVPYPRASSPDQYERERYWFCNSQHTMSCPCQEGVIYLYSTCRETVTWWNCDLTHLTYPRHHRWAEASSSLFYLKQRFRVRFWQRSRKYKEEWCTAQHLFSRDLLSDSVVLWKQPRVRWGSLWVLTPLPTNPSFL